MSTQTVGEFISALAAVAPLDGAAGWDPVGLQLGDRDEPVGSVAVCHEVTTPVVAAVLERSIDTLVTYHPLLFHAARRLVAGPGATGRAHRLVRGGVNLIVVHTAFDVAPGGTADALADALGLERVTGFGARYAAIDRLCRPGPVGGGPWSAGGSRCRLHHRSLRLSFPFDRCC
jgi:putative NIF3 family GTP cyclohydrolase 1 type 2